MKACKGKLLFLYQRISEKSLLQKTKRAEKSKDIYLEIFLCDFAATTTFHQKGVDFKTSQTSSNLTQPTCVTNEPESTVLSLSVKEKNEQNRAKERDKRCYRIPTPFLGTLHVLMEILLQRGLKIQDTVCRFDRQWQCVLSNWTV